MPMTQYESALAAAGTASDTAHGAQSTADRLVRTVLAILETPSMRGEPDLALLRLALAAGKEVTDGAVTWLLNVCPVVRVDEEYGPMGATHDGEWPFGMAALWPVGWLLEERVLTVTASGARHLMLTLEGRERAVAAATPTAELAAMIEASLTAKPMGDGRDFVRAGRVR